MKQSRVKLAQTVARRSLEGKDTAKLSREVAAYLLQEGRVGELESILRDVQVDWAEAGMVEILAYRAHALSADTKREITGQVKNVYPQATKITITEIEDPEVIGGVRLVMPNQQFDLSVEAKLAKFKQLTMTGKD